MSARTGQHWLGYGRLLRQTLAGGFAVPASCQAQQSALLRRRLQVLAQVIAVLSLAWILIDAIGLQRAELAGVLPLRIGLAIALLQLARHAASMPSTDVAKLFLWLQAVAFAAMQWCLDDELGGALRAGYGLTAFVVTAQLAVLPLPWGRALRLGLAPLALLFAPVLLGVRTPDITLWNDLWLFGLILALAAWASHAQLALLVDLLRARQDASHDSLTGLANRRSALRRLDSDRNHALRHGERLSTLMLDLDHFKHVNDQWGHASGDLVLVATARVLGEELRGADMGARFGGEEFLAILPATEPAQAMEVAERIRGRIARLSIEVPGGMVSITTSIGIATLELGESVTSLLARTDAALYAAKAGGRNRCEHAGPALADPVDPRG